jgi:hypothetical protein
MFLPFWFSGIGRRIANALSGLDSWAFPSALRPFRWAYCGAAPVQSADMEFSRPGRNAGFGFRDAGRWWTPAETNPSVSQPRALTSYFAEESPDPDVITPQSGPLLVMPPVKKPKRSALWLQRLWLVVFVLFCLEVGIILTVLPWTKLWTDNSLLLSYPALRDFLMLGFVRGVVSGLGLVDIWMGVAEAVTYHESPRN